MAFSGDAVTIYVALQEKCLTSPRHSSNPVKPDSVAISELLFNINNCNISQEKKGPHKNINYNNVL